MKLSASQPLYHYYIKHVANIVPNKKRLILKPGWKIINKTDFMEKIHLFNHTL